MVFRSRMHRIKCRRVSVPEKNIWYQIEYAGFRHYNVPLWVLLRKWGMKGVCLRKRWGKCYMRCIVKFSFLAFIEWTMFIVEWVSEIIHIQKNTLNRARINPFCDISKFGWYWNTLKYSKEMNGCNYMYEPFLIIT